MLGSRRPFPSNRSFHHLPAAPSIQHDGVPETRSEPLEGPARPRGRSFFTIQARPCDTALSRHQDRDNNAQEWPNCEPPVIANPQLALSNRICASRLRPSTRPSRRPRPLAYGSMPAPEPRLRRRTAPHTFSSTLHSRSVAEL